MVNEIRAILGGWINAKKAPSRGLFQGRNLGQS